MRHFVDTGIFFRPSFWAVFAFSSATLARQRPIGMGPRNSKSAAELARESRVAWFAVLERAMIQRQPERAAQAIRELRRLGVNVTYDEAADLTPLDFEQRGVAR